MTEYTQKELRVFESLKAAKAAAEDAVSARDRVLQRADALEEEVVELRSHLKVAASSQFLASSPASPQRYPSHAWVRVKVRDTREGAASCAGMRYTWVFATPRQRGRKPIRQEPARTYVCPQRCSSH